MRKLKCGTRKSLLAWAQSGWVAREIERLSENVSVELVGIETRGDRIVDIPLREAAGKEFFVAELDEALRSGAVDFTVHSMKDLSLDRPHPFVCAAIPRRENPRDVIVFGPGAHEKIERGESLRIGTSSPRRLVNIPPFLEKALPRINGHEPRVELIEIRGNVNTRLGRVHERVGSERQLDGVVLAFAGLIRLWNDETARKSMQTLLEGVRWMVLPLRECPAAPAQGALAVECRADDAFLRSALSRLHDTATEASVTRERALLREWGGGCHQKFGATSIDHPLLKELFYVRGEKPDGEKVDELRWKAPPPPVGEIHVWDGSLERDKNVSEEDIQPNGNLAHRPVFVAHSRAVRDFVNLSEARVWTSGVSSWHRLARNGVWVEGCAEGLGFDYLERTLQEPVLRLDKPWAVLTHEAAKSEWVGKAEAIATYRLLPNARTRASGGLEGATHVFWSSGSQWDELNPRARPKAHHACGPGKTAEKLGSALVFPSVEEWRKWLSSR